ncbi:hypothetical protein ACIBAG_29455 [Streptomyces sp. NPDC051243]|uniref:hypothetical protein n=1 Tax=Streptomyces sp. NPDC051243 TaxID=3365646 RepID=UPI00379C1F69
MRRMGLAAAGVTFGGLLLGGCSPAHLSLAAAWLDEDGRPMARVRPCDDDQSADVRLRAYPSERRDGRRKRGHPTANGWETQPLKALGDTTFPLFAPPASWHPETVGPRRLLSGGSYHLEFTTYESEDLVDYVGEVTFTAEELAALRPGQVRADGRAMSPGEFEELAEDSC